MPAIESSISKGSEAQSDQGEVNIATFRCLEFIKLQAKEAGLSAYELIQEIRISYEAELAAVITVSP